MQEKNLGSDVSGVLTRLEAIFGPRSDVQVSRWLGRADNYISSARKRCLIDVEAVLEKVDPKDWAFILGRAGRSVEKSHAPSLGESQLPALRLRDAFKVLGEPDEVAADVGATPKQVRDWMSGKAQPSPEQLALLFNEVARTAAVLMNAMAKSRCDCDGKRPESVLPATGTGK